MGVKGNRRAPAKATSFALLRLAVIPDHIFTTTFAKTLRFPEIESRRRAKFLKIHLPFGLSQEINHKSTQPLGGEMPAIQRKVFL